MFIKIIKFMNTKNLIFSLLLIVSILFIACKKTTSNDTKSEVKKHIVKFLVVPIPEMKDDSIENPMSEIKLTVDSKEYKIAKVPGVGTQVDETIFPKDALASCSTWWAGSGDFFYATLVDNKVIIYKGWDGEGNEENGYNWEKIKEINCN
jgi:hypothetical protein